MFLFKKKKDGPEEKTMLDKTEALIKSAKENSKEKFRQKAGSDLPDKRNQGKQGQSGAILDASQNLETDAPMKVVIPASSLLEDQDVISVKASESTGLTITEEDVDKLLVEVNKDKPAAEIPDISLDILVPPKEAVEKPKQATGQSIEVKLEPKPEVKSESKLAAKSEAKPSEPAADKDKKTEGADGGNLFSNLFGKVEVEEDNPLQRLMNSLPTISMDEVMIEAEEVKGIMSEWYLKQGKRSK
jgi:hypothetical protein